MCGCGWCQRNPYDPSDEWFDAFLKAHPLDPIQQEEVERSTANLKKRFRSDSGPVLNL